MTCLDKRDDDFEFRARETWRITINAKHQGGTVGTLVNTGKSLGSGSFGKVFTGTWESSQMSGGPVPVAIKVSSGREGYIGARVLTRLKSPFVVGVYQYAWTEGSEQSVAAYEKLGKSAKTAWYDGTLDPVGFDKAVLQGALAGAEKNIFHMDIKPSNILREDIDAGNDAISKREDADDCNGVIWKIIDWDLLKEGPPDAKYEGYQGTFASMAPGKEINVFLVIS